MREKLVGRLWLGEDDLTLEEASREVAKFERAAMARAVRFAAKQAEERLDDGRPHINPNELMRIADRIESGEVEVS